MNVITAVKCRKKMANESGPGLKIILLDKETTSIISMAFSQSDMLQGEVYLFERLDSGRSNERLKHLKSIVFVRPTKQNIALLADELRNPKYGSYYIYFSNIIPRTDIKILAECDESESVREVKESYADYLCVNPNLFSFNIPTSLNRLTWQPEALNRCVQGLTSVLLSLKMNPVIRYRTGSIPAQTLAKQIFEQTTKGSSLFDFRTHENGVPPPLLLILDRVDDPVTPLLHQWTYQAMVHELLNIKNYRVDLSGTPQIPKDFKEVVLSGDHGEFYAKNMYANYGEIGSTIKSLMEEFQKKSKGSEKVVNTLVRESVGAAELQKKKAKIQSFSDTTSSTLKKHVYANYMQFINTAKEISHLESEMYQLSHILIAQRNILGSLIEGSAANSSDRDHVSLNEENEDIQSQNAARAIKELVQGYKGDLEGKIFLHEGALIELDSNDHRPIQRVFFFLFNDTLIVCKVKHDRRLEFVLPSAR